MIILWDVESRQSLGYFDTIPVSFFVNNPDGGKKDGRAVHVLKDPRIDKELRICELLTKALDFITNSVVIQ